MALCIKNDNVSSLNVLSALLCCCGMVGIALQSVSGFLALLEEPDQQLQTYALAKLNDLVDQFWHEISDSISIM